MDFELESKSVDMKGVIYLIYQTENILIAVEFTNLVNSHYICHIFHAEIYYLNYPLGVLHK